MQGLHLTGDSCHRLLARPAIPQLHRLHRLIDHVSHGHSALRGVKQGVHPGWNSHPAVTCSQPCLLRREWEHGNSCSCSCIDRLYGTLLCPLQVIQGPRVIVRPASLTWVSTYLTERVAVAYRCREVNCPECCCRCVDEPRSKTQPSRIQEDRTTQSAPNGGSCVKETAMGSTLPVRCGKCYRFAQ